MIPKQRIQGLKGKPGRQFQYELSFMHMVVPEYLKGDFSTAQVAKKHNISTAQLSGWITRFSSDLSDEIPIPIAMTDKESKDQESLKKQIEELNKKLARAEMKISGLELMIDIAEEDLNIDIRKKSGTEQSKG